MLLTITTTQQPATDLGYLLYKHPARVQTFDLAFGTAHVFYPEATTERCTAALLLDIDPVGLIRRTAQNSGFALAQYVNDRPYAASSFLSVAINQVYGTALAGTCRDRPQLAEMPLPLEATVAVVPSRGGADLLTRLFAPLGYELTLIRHLLDAQFPEWGDSHYYTVTLQAHVRLQDLLSHLYVLIPVLDNDKHYFVGNEEVEKLLRHGADWLATHPEKALIAERYLRYQRTLQREALSRLVAEEAPDLDAHETNQDAEEALVEAATAVESTAASTGSATVGSATVGSATVGSATVGSATVGSATVGSTANLPKEQRITLHDQRLTAVLAALKAAGAQRVLDLGCGEGRLLALLLKESTFTEIVGVDVSHRALERAADRLRLDRLPAKRRERLTLLHGSLTYHDERLHGYDAAVVVEVIEHLDPARLTAFAQMLFGAAKPQTVVITTPNGEYNVLWESLPAGQFRHRDHRFEWSRAEFATWATQIAAQFDYTIEEIAPVGPVDPTVGAPSQIGVFRRS